MTESNNEAVIEHPLLSGPLIQAMLSLEALTNGPLTWGALDIAWLPLARADSNHQPIKSMVLRPKSDVLRKILDRKAVTSV
jgi:hypothetical protein